ncbi:MAG: hypothetical protein II972_05960, partial [Elusimicrobiaceae bacterium]|nr:hypothetical protein [Elusimicrobiaceae bacterium]
DRQTDRQTDTLLLTEVFSAVSKINFVVANKTLIYLFLKKVNKGFLRFTLPWQSAAGEHLTLSNCPAAIFY